MNTTPRVSQIPIATDPAQQSPAAAVNSANSGGKAQDFAAALSSAGAKPTRKAAATAPTGTGAGGGQLPAPGNLPPPPTSPGVTAAAAAMAAVTAATGASDTAATAAAIAATAAGAAAGAAGPGGTALDPSPPGAAAGNPAIPGAQASALLGPPGAASFKAAAADPGAGLALIGGLPVDPDQAKAPSGDAAAPAVTAVGPEAAATALATAAELAGAPRAAQATAQAPSIAASKSPVAARTGDKVFDGGITAAAAVGTATPGSGAADGNAAASTPANAWTNTDVAAQAPTAAAISAAASGVVSPGAAFAGAADSPSSPALADSATPAAAIMARGAGRANGASVPVLLVSATRPAAAAAAPRGANAQTVAALDDASAPDKRASSGTDYSLLSGTIDSAAGALQLGVNTAAPADAVPAPTLKVAAGVESSEFGQGVAEHLSFMLDNNMNGAKLQVNPPQLGPIEVRIAVQGGHAQIWLTSHSAVTRDALESSSPTLREMLGAQGFGQVSVDISQRSFQERSTQPQPYDWTPSANRSPALTAVRSTERAARSNPSGVVDAYA
ncbi:MAG TPA: flagellar hook-length control protein FliK [Steroidobacteraceae bacterium]|nr:flagellar hook-length control protein FliK [Steroidobacteraceae bacterium]